MFRFHKIDPVPISNRDSLKAKNNSQQIVALDVVNKYVFYDKQGIVFHEYALPSDPDIYNCGGYADKVSKYRDPLLLEHLQIHGVTETALSSPNFPILSSQSPKLDLILFRIIKSLLDQKRSERVTLFDLGCTVAEHYDLLDVFFQAEGGCAETSLSYTGLDQSSLLLSTARLMHPDLSPAQFKLIKSEGSRFEMLPGCYDVGLSVGVINHVAKPHTALKKLLTGCRWAVVVQLWVTKKDDGVWHLNHSGIPFYFFSKKDLSALGKEAGMQICLGEFTPQEENSQVNSFLGISNATMKTLGSYQVVFTRMEEFPLGLKLLDHMIND